MMYELGAGTWVNLGDVVAVEVFRIRETDHARVVVHLRGSGDVTHVFDVSADASDAAEKLLLAMNGPDAGPYR